MAVINQILDTLKLPQNTYLINHQYYLLFKLLKIFTNKYLTNKTYKIKNTMKNIMADKIINSEKIRFDFRKLKKGFIKDTYSIYASSRLFQKKI